MNKLEDALWDADAAFKRLKPDQGPVGRRNGRNAMLKALRKARKALDTEFPLERKVRRRKRKKHRLDGYSEVTSSQVKRLLLAGIHRTQFKQSPRPEDVRSALRNGRDPKKLVRVYWAPNWIVRALDAKIDIRTIVKAIRSQPTRKGIETIIRLGFKKTGS